MTQRGRAGARAGSRPGARRARDDAEQRVPVPRIDLAAARGRVRQVIEPVVTAAGFDLEDLSVSRAGRRHVVRVLVDTDGGINLDDVAVVSREISAALDEAEERGGEVLAGEYQLEVGSPGVDRPLTLPRHWRRNAGRLVSVEVGPQKAREQVTGRLLRVTDEGVVLAVEKGGAKKGQVRRAVGERSVPWTELGEGRVQVEFTRPPGHRDAELVVTVPDDDDLSDADLSDDDLHDDLNDEHDLSGSGGEQ
jgi:ribosome maturation factor RimP